MTIRAGGAHTADSFPLANYPASLSGLQRLLQFSVTSGHCPEREMYGLVLSETHSQSKTKVLRFLPSDMIRT